MFKNRSVQMKIVKDNTILESEQPVKVIVVKPDQIVEDLAFVAVGAYAAFKAINLASNIVEAVAVKSLA